jgi:hypothetical protein
MSGEEQTHADALQQAGSIAQADEMQEATQEEIDLEAHLAAARNAQYAREDEDELIEQVRPHPHFFFQLYKRCWGKPNRHQYRTMRRYLKYCL